MVLYSGGSWASWDVAAEPVVPEGMPVLVDDDLLFADGLVDRPVVAMNRWLRELPSSGAPARSTWVVYGRVLRDWAAFIAIHGVHVFDGRERLKLALGAYATLRATGPLDRRFEATTWNQHVSVLASFYRWAVAEGYASAEPFSYRAARVLYGDMSRDVRVNLAVRRTPKPHVAIKYLERDFASMLLNGLAGLRPDGSPDPGVRRRHLARDRAGGHLALATGLRLQEFTHLLVPEIPALPAVRSSLPIAFPVPAAVTKGSKFRTTWITYEALAEVHLYVRLDRELAVSGSTWHPRPGAGGTLLVTEVSPVGGRVNGRWVRWAVLSPAERLALVGPDGGSMLWALRGDGGPFVAWSTVLTRVSQRIRLLFEPRFPHVYPHRLRHTFAIMILELLVGGHYAQAAKLVKDADADAALMLYLSKADPLMVLRDLLGHSSTLTTEKYLRRLDMTRIYRDAYDRAGLEHGLTGWEDGEVAAEFADEVDDI